MEFELGLFNFPIKLKRKYPEAANLKLARASEKQEETVSESWLT